MDASLTGALPVTVIGVATVFAALCALVLVIKLMTRFFAEAPQEAAPAPAATREPSSSTGAIATPDAEPELLPVALAAYALHLQIRGRASAAPATPNNSAWALAGRVQQLTRLSR